MSLDTGAGGADGEDVDPVAEALTIELAGRPRKAVSDALGLHPSQAGRILDGKRPLSPRQIATIERAWDLPLGTVLRRAGLVEDAQSTRDAIRGDPTLTPKDRGAVLRFYDSFAE